MSKYIDADKLIERLEEMKQAEYENCGGVNSKTGALQEVQELIASLQQEQPETDMKSPFTGGKVTILSREEEVTFRGEKVKITRKYYHCEDTGREFTDSKLDEDMMWAVFRVYCEKKGMTSFTDIMLKQEQPEVNLEKEIKFFLTNAIKMNSGQWRGEYHIGEIGIRAIAHRFYELGLNARKEK
jgi:hypothetical protein